LPEFLAAAIHELSIKFSPSSAVLTTTIIVATIAAVFSPVTGNPINPATTTNSGNLATTPESSSRPQSSADLRILKHCRLSGLSCQSQEGQPWRSNYFRSVNTIINDGPAARTEWARVPITFTEEDFRLKSAIHNDAMVIDVNIAGWVIRKVLVDN
jgi:hypothetical protein